MRDRSYADLNPLDPSTDAGHTVKTLRQGYRHGSNLLSRVVDPAGAISNYVGELLGVRDYDNELLALDTLHQRAPRRF